MIPAIPTITVESCASLAIPIGLILFIWYGRLFNETPRSFLCRPGDFSELAQLPEPEQREIFGHAIRRLLRTPRGFIPIMLWIVGPIIGSSWFWVREFGVFQHHWWVGVAWICGFVMAVNYVAGAVERAFLRPIVRELCEAKLAGGEGSHSR